MRQLDDSQIEAFDTEYVDDARWRTVKACIDRDFPDGAFTFLDVGGGIGVFADRTLAAYPKSSGTVVENSAILLSRNQPNTRKTVLLESIENIEHVEKKYDIICLHWLLHHVVSDTYAHTRRNQLWSLRAVSALLTERGRISIFENAYDGILIDNLPGRIIYRVTSSQAASGIVRRLGANTAGVGVCFLSKKQWLLTIHDARLGVLDYAEPDIGSWSLSMLRRICLHVRRRFVGHFWLCTTPASRRSGG